MRSGTPQGNYSLVNYIAFALNSDKWIILLGFVCLGRRFWAENLFLANLSIMGCLTLLDNIKSMNI